MVASINQYSHTIVVKIFTMSKSLSCVLSRFHLWFLFDRRARNIFLARDREMQIKDNQPPSPMWNDPNDVRLFTRSALKGWSYCSSLASVKSAVCRWCVFEKVCWSDSSLARQHDADKTRENERTDLNKRIIETWNLTNTVLAYLFFLLCFRPPCGRRSTTLGKAKGAARPAFFVIKQASSGQKKEIGCEGGDRRPEQDGSVTVRHMISITSRGTSRERPLPWRPLVFKVAHTKNIFELHCLLS